MPSSAWGVAFKAQGLALGILGPGFGVEGLGLKVWGLRFGILGFRPVGIPHPKPIVFGFKVQCAWALQLRVLTLRFRPGGQGLWLMVQ